MMKYDSVISGTFIDRPNRFIANVTVDGTDGSDPAVRCHVKNTGRYDRLLTGGQSLGMDCFSV